MRNVKVVFFRSPPGQNSFPGIVSVLETPTGMVVKTVDIIHLEFYDLETPDQGCHIWNIDIDHFLDDRPEVLSRAGIFPLQGRKAFTVEEIRGIGYPPGEIGYNMQENFYTTGTFKGHSGLVFGSGMDDKGPVTGRIGYFVLRRQNEVENDPHLLVLAISNGAQVQCEFPYDVVNTWEEVINYFNFHSPFDIEYTGPSTFSGEGIVDLPFDVLLDVDLPPGWENFYVKVDKGTAPLTIPILNKKGVIPFNPTGMNVGDTATITTGLEWTRRAESFTITKV